MTTIYDIHTLEAKVQVLEHKVGMLQREVMRLRGLIRDAHLQLYDGHDETAFIVLDNYVKSLEDEPEET